MEEEWIYLEREREKWKKRICYYCVIFLVYLWQPTSQPASHTNRPEKKLRAANLLLFLPSSKEFRHNRCAHFFIECGKTHGQQQLKAHVYANLFCLESLDIGNLTLWTLNLALLHGVGDTWLYRYVYVYANALFPMLFPVPKFHFHFRRSKKHAISLYLSMQKRWLPRTRYIRTLPLDTIVPASRPNEKCVKVKQKDVFVAEKEHNCWTMEQNIRRSLLCIGFLA